jgi:hypothetical protein
VGVGREEYALPEGATLGDLIQKAGIHSEGRSIYVDGFLRTEHFIMQSSMVVILPSLEKDRWRQTIGMFEDDTTFQEFVDRIQARRERDRKRARRID